MFKLLVSITCLAVLAALVYVGLGEVRTASEKARIERLLVRAASGHCDMDLSPEDLATCKRFQAASAPAYPYNANERAALQSLIGGTNP